MISSYKYSMGINDSISKYNMLILGISFKYSMDVNDSISLNIEWMLMIALVLSIAWVLMISLVLSIASI